MNWRISFTIIFLILFSCSTEKQENKTSFRSSYLISAEELFLQKENSNIKILDFRKKEFYDIEHIENAIHIWRNHITNNEYNYGGMMASPVQMEKLFSGMGINNSDTIVIYDDSGLCEAARLWWILQNYDFDNVRLLEGGLSKWKETKGKTSNKAPVLTTSTFKLPEIQSMKYFANKELVSKSLSSHVIIDTRSEDEYLGKVHKKGAAKAGRIPNSRHLDWAESIDFHGDQSLKSIAQLEKVYKKLNITKNDSIILYCHSGVRSAHTTFVLTQLLNFKNVRNYDGSWTEWSHFEELPYETENIIN